MTWDGQMDFIVLFGARKWAFFWGGLDGCESGSGGREEEEE
jgi:hypothetical protein